MNLERYRDLFYKHLRENDLILQNDSWGHDNFVDKDARYLFSLFCLTESRRKMKHLILFTQSTMLL